MARSIRGGRNPKLLKGHRLSSKLPRHKEYTVVAKGRGKPVKNRAIKRTRHR